MAHNKQEERAVRAAFQKRFRKFSRLELAFYGSIIITAVLMAVGIIYLQSRNLQVKQDITEINSQISDAETDLNNAKQEVNELTRSDRIAEIAKKAGLNIDNSNLGNVGSNK
ncbi:Cell division protein ftsL [Streptococcus criceti]|uniref:Cell division protein FtsL n=1 Tax=Streptococcus criceti HS-6 TaxID=873449 RepID=G5JRQ8_STRCG|nr:cell division protein FtsL [Streptococcus criceti]EHI73631.1 cell division protein FtsL [Streptococcus criceti HS-6]SUN43701.1 Cell division protein ftsL [Streptococcus criceti]